MDGRANNGGPRPNSGRPKGLANTKTRDAAIRYLASGLPTPLDFMLAIMNSEHELLSSRYEAARDCAPYLHPKLAAAQVELNAQLQIVVDDKLDNEDDGGGLA